MIFGIAIGLALLFIFAGIVAYSILRVNKDEPEETIYDTFEPEMVSLDDIPDEVIDELSKPTGYVLTSEELKEAMYQKDISESMPELAEKLEELPEEEIDFYELAPEYNEDLEYPILDISPWPTCKKCKNSEVKENEEPCASCKWLTRNMGDPDFYEVKKNMEESMKIKDILEKVKRIDEICDSFYKCPFIDPKKSLNMDDNTWDAIQTVRSNDAQELLKEYKDILLNIDVKEKK